MSAINVLVLSARISKNFTGEIEHVGAEDTPKVWLPVYQRVWKGKDNPVEYRNFSITLFGKRAEYANRSLKAGQNVQILAELEIKFDKESGKNFVNIHVQDLVRIFPEDVDESGSSERFTDEQNDQDEFPF